MRERERMTSLLPKPDFDALVRKNTRAATAAAATSSQSTTKSNNSSSSSNVKSTASSLKAKIEDLKQRSIKNRLRRKLSNLMLVNVNKNLHLADQSQSTTNEPIKKSTDFRAEDFFNKNRESSYL